MKQLKDFQKVGVNFMLNRKTALLADDMGLGKTIQAAGVIDKLHAKRVLVLTLASLKINWEREIRDVVHHDYKYQTLFKVADRVDECANIIICNYDLIIHKAIKSQLTKLHYDVIILDEAHNLSNMEAQRSKCVYSNTGLIRCTDRVYALTGTPVRNRPKDFYIMLKVLAPECIEPYTNYEDYAVRYCGGYREQYGNLNDKGASNIEELAERIKPFMLRRMKSEVLEELPPVIEKTIELETTQEIQDVLNIESELEEDLNEFNPDSELGLQAKIRRLLGVAKIPQVLEYVENVLATEDKVVIFAYHREVIDKIRIALKGYGVCAIQGGLSAKQKQFEVDLFVNDPTRRIFIGQFTAAGFGVDGLQKVANNVIFAEIDWVPGNVEQARDRLNRMGQNRPVVAHYLVTPNTLEDNMLNTVIRKGKVIARLLSNTEREKEENDMSIETSLERIAVALEVLAGAVNSECNCACATQPAEEPKKKAASKKKAETKEAAQPAAAEPAQPAAQPAAEEPADDLFGETPAETTPAYTADDVRVAFQSFLGRIEDRAAGVAKGKEILAKYGYAKVPDVQEKDFAAIINELKVA